MYHPPVNDPTDNGQLDERRLCVSCNREMDVDDRDDTCADCREDIYGT